MAADLAIIIRTQTSNLTCLVRLSDDSTWTRESSTPGQVNTLTLGAPGGCWKYKKDSERLVLKDWRGAARVVLTEVPIPCFREGRNDLEFLEGGTGSLVNSHFKERAPVTWEGLACRVG
jgi:hypothetical protein